MSITNSKIIFPLSLINKYIISRKHPSKDLCIYNYSHSAQYDKKWNKYTLIARGLVLDGNNIVVSRPFPKFFNWGELSIDKQQILSNKKYERYEKIDGYFIQAFLYDDEPIITSRGSFDSIYSQKAEELFMKKHSNFLNNMEKNKTYIFELIWSEHRIIVDYDKLEDLILLAITDSKTGKDIEIKDNMGFLRPKEYSYQSIIDILQENKKNAEGYVLFFPDTNFRVKIKFEEYTKISRALSHLNEKVIWSLLKSKEQSFDLLLEKIPDEFYDWVFKTIKDLKNKYNDIEQECLNFYKEKNIDSLDIKNIAEKIKNHRYKSIIFSIKRQKNYSEIIWQIIKPKVKGRDIEIGAKII